MTDDEILEALAAARYSVSLDGRTFHCRPPDLPELLIELQALAPHSDIGRLPTELFAYAGAAASVIGWDGVTEADLFAGRPAEPQPFSRLAVRRLLAERVDWQAALRNEYVTRAAARSAEREAAEKN